MERARCLFAHVPYHDVVAVFASVQEIRDLAAKPWNRGGQDPRTASHRSDITGVRLTHSMKARHKPAEAL